MKSSYLPFAIFLVSTAFLLSPRAQAKTDTPAELQSQVQHLVQQGVLTFDPATGEAQVNVRALDESSVVDPNDQPETTKPKTTAGCCNEAGVNIVQ